ncbi:MAG: hypothetical protein P1V34_12020 [Alphaproteobacteria bacterium]|nr:hypothetical protein [Alphaproteobacteria bacterium]
MTLKLKLFDTAHDLMLKQLRPALSVNIGGQDHSLIEQCGVGPERRIEIDGKQIFYRQARDGNTVYLHLEGRNWVVDFIDPRDAAQVEAAGSDAIRAPMPGAVISIEKEPGATVLRGETVLTIESMKLQTNLIAPRDGTLATVLKTVGETFEKGEVVAMMETDDA